jgi:hypothetical protein
MAPGERASRGRSWWKSVAAVGMYIGLLRTLVSVTAILRCDVAEFLLGLVLKARVRLGLDLNRA